MTTLATETWTGTNGASWPGQWTTAANAGAAPTIQSNQGRMTTGAGGFANGPSALLSGMTSVADVDATVFYISPLSDGGTFTLLSVRADAYSSSTDPTNGITLISQSDDGSAWIRRSVAGSNSDVTTQTGYITITPGDTIGMRLQMIGTAIQAKIWNQTLGAEPGTWTITTTDGSVTAAGKVGIAVFNSTAFVHDVQWDSLTVTDAVTSFPLTGSAASTSSTTGAMVARRVLAGAAQSTSTSTGAIGTNAFAGAAQSTSTTTGALAGDYSDVYSDSYALASILSLTGSAASGSTTTGALTLVAGAPSYTLWSFIRRSGGWVRKGQATIP